MVYKIQFGPLNLQGQFHVIGDTLAVLTVVAGSIRNITNGSGFDDVPDHELLDRLILRDAAGAIGATHGLDVAAVVLAASSITPLLSLKRKE